LDRSWICDASAANDLSSLRRWYGSNKLMKKVVAAGLPRHPASGSMELWRDKPAATSARAGLKADARAPERAHGQRGGSPLQARTLRPVTDSNCVAARRGGEQLKVNDQSVTQVNSIRPYCAASLLGNGEARTGATRKPMTLRGSVRKRSWGRLGGWRRNGRTARHMKQRDLPG